MSNHSVGTPLSRKLLLLGALPAIVMFITLMGFFTSARLDDARRGLSDSSQLLADSLAPSLEYAVVSGNTLALQEILSQSIQHSKADWIRVTDVVGEQIGLANHDNSQAKHPPNDFKIYAAEILQKPLEFETDRETLWFEPEYGFASVALRVGTVEVGVSDRVLEARRTDILWSSVAVGLSLLVFTILVISHTLNAILSPINQMSGRISRLIERDYRTAKVNRKSNSREIIAIEQQLNELAEHLGTLKSSRDQTLAASEHAREKAESASHAKSEFLATMSHELRTPLNGVLGMVDLVQEETLSLRQRDYLHTARQSTEDLLTVISDILDYSRMESGAFVLEQQMFNIHTLITNCVASYRHVAEEQGLALTLNFYGDWPETPLVTGDAPRIRQILACLLDNAIKFTSDGFVNVQVGCFGVEDGCIILNCSVSDSGNGIPHERITDIFSSFEQLDTGDTRSFGGAGMGLSLVQRLVELLGGHIQVDTDPGKGSSFRFELPIELASPVETPAASEATLQTELPLSMRALVVEDNPVNQRVAVALLNRLGFHTDAVTNGKEALDKVRSGHQGYDAILMDCQMPIMDGYETTRYIREWEVSNGLERTPVIALTADVLPSTEHNCLESGMDDYLSKPVRKQNLRDVMERWVKLPTS
ncbi:Signal transduction histidine kinase [Marinobacter sp. LV10R510-11A]|uniref:ATP-binding protein n=1 Tax=Marinobacter sp. LV10R510-11A TaxID=1415568 RepID=UPI000BB86627|nr:ATP-binding protein [Marinobacter sp. LV10R510-11A]SOB75556.1 Signal transduction histidine kinase [Marinobacter sp. LV10R510-11A]